MEDTSEYSSERKKTKHICIGILAHVDAGKTTLSEAILFQSGRIRKMGRVDAGDAYLDTDEIERERGITIFSKQVEFVLGEKHFTLLDTPGHVDFSAEMERTLLVLDYAVLVISGADGVQGHTRTLWKLLEQYSVPVFVFVNKMDQPGADREKLFRELRAELSDSCVDFGEGQTERFYEEIAMCAGEDVLEHFLSEGTVGRGEIVAMIRKRQVFPCYFGSALRLESVPEFTDGLYHYMDCASYPAEFGARVFKITRDCAGVRLAHMKITGGSLKMKAVLGEDKVNQIRIYSGEKYETAAEAEAGCVCAVVGLDAAEAGMGLGIERGNRSPLLEPVLHFALKLPCDAAEALPKLRQLEEEEPQLHMIFNEELGEIQVQLMGEVQIEVLKQLMLKRFGLKVEFGVGRIVYKETIADTVEGVGHFEPLRHYAEVHLLLEPAERGTGLQFETNCSEDSLERNWQRLIMTHLAERTHRGVLTGSPITDMRITLVGGRAHAKHTVGGDFRQATYRALRQGLMQAQSVLLEPYYSFRMELPEQMLGRAMTDVEKMSGTMQPPKLSQGSAVLCGTAPVACMQNYPQELSAYTKGMGKVSMELAGYFPCHNSDEVIEQMGYDPLADPAHSPDSVFCAHGAGYVVGWDEVKDHMHVEGYLSKESGNLPLQTMKRQERRAGTEWIDAEEIDAILEKTFRANTRDKERAKNKVPGRGRTRGADSAGAPVRRTYRPSPPPEEYLLVDGYNVIFAWEKLKELASVNLEGARGKLLDLLCDYQGIRGCRLIVVFDAYRVKGHRTEIFDYHNIHVVFTKEAETADQFIEKFAHENGKKYRIIVATSDGLEQIIIRGEGCILISARELLDEILEARERAFLQFSDGREQERKYLFDALSEETKENMQRALKENVQRAAKEEEHRVSKRIYRENEDYAGRGVSGVSEKL